MPFSFQNYAYWSSIHWPWYIEIKQHKSLCSAIIHVLFPAIFDDMFTRNDNIHNHYTRQKLHVPLHVPLPQTNLVKMSVCYTGVTRWNYHTKFIDTYSSLDVYKKRLRMYIHKHRVKYIVSTIFIHLCLVILLITIECNISVYILYVSLQPVYPI